MYMCTYSVVKSKCKPSCVLRSGDKTYAMSHKRGGGEVVVRAGYHLVQPPTAHSSRDHVITTAKAWSSQAIPVHQGYRSVSI